MASPRRNALAVAAVLALAAALAIVPAALRRVQRPSDFYPTLADARRTADAGARLPPLLPPSAREIHAETDRATRRTFVRFAYDPADSTAMQAGLRRLPPAEVERLPVPRAGWSRWWRLAPQTLRGSQGERVHVYEAPPERGGGYLVLDPRTGTAYFWSR
ncbi:MAG TPA: hypothetical protein VFX98_14030 [Longimicrobiaceae bacterium]|nr:hypothetical protein [Longimicrobiaceae bacterium]